MWWAVTSFLQQYVVAPIYELYFIVDSIRWKNKEENSSFYFLYQIKICAYKNEI